MYIVFCTTPVSTTLHHSTMLSYRHQELAVSPLTPTVAIWVQLQIKHPVSDRVKQSFVIFDIWAL